MSDERGTVADTDAIVIVELTLDGYPREVETIVALIRSGAQAFLHSPVVGTDMVGILQRRDVAEFGMRIAAEIETEARVVYERVQQAHRDRTKPQRRSRKSEL